MRWSSGSSSTAASSVVRCSPERSDASGDGAASPETSEVAARSARPARRPAERRRLRASLATMRKSQGRKGAPSRKRPSARHALTKPSCAASSASARVPRDHVRGAEGDPLVCVHELLVGVCVTALRASNQVRFVEWPAHHRPFYTVVRYEVPTRITPPRGHGAGEARAGQPVDRPVPGTLTGAGAAPLLSTTTTGLSGGATRSKAYTFPLVDSVTSAPFGAQAGRAVALRARV